MHLDQRFLYDNQQDVEDAVSQTIISLIEKVSLIKSLPRPVLRAYVVSTIRNTPLNHVRYKQRRCMQGVPLDDALMKTIPDASQDVEASVLNDDSVAHMEAMIEKPNEREAELLRQRYFLDLSDQEITKVWNVKPETVRKAIYRARKHLMALYAKEGDFS
ncbi:MAG: RNA polymerase sigma factor [Christensenellaceae bacterium]|nr:RNA polymerase sigma factor [Christensenellaceae bacterium]